MKRFIYLLLVLMIALPMVAKTQKTATLTGTIRDEKGKKLAYVNVSVFSGETRITGAQTNAKGKYIVKNIPAGKYRVRYSLIGFGEQNINLTLKSGKTRKQNVTLKREGMAMETVVISDNLDAIGVTGSAPGMSRHDMSVPVSGAYAPPYMPPHETEEYTAIKPNIFHSPLLEALSTFSIDVDTANYSNLRRFLMEDQLPPANSIRIEELVNYFKYAYPKPKGKHPFSIYTEMGVVPWNQKRNLIHIGIQARELDLSTAPPSNLVFLIDVSGSMNTQQKLPLVKESLKMLVENLRPQDQLAIVVYAGAAGLVLPSSDGTDKEKIMAAIDNLQAGGSTAGGAGIQLAYKTAIENYMKGGNNRIIMCSDGDFNVGVSSTAEMEKLVTDYRDKGVYLTVLGYGMGNYKDNRMETLADKGNGNYAYIDNSREAKKVLVDQLAGTLYTLAKDMKIQVEFNPAHVKAYRLIGYENRILNKEDFVDDTKDAGELGAGHSVTAIYEIIPTNSKEEIPDLIPLKYQEVKISEEAKNSPELCTVKIRYKLPGNEESILVEGPVYNKTLGMEDVSETYLFSSAVVGYGLLLSESEHKAALTWDLVKEMAESNLGEDMGGYRKEFIELIQRAAKLTAKKMK